MSLSINKKTVNFQKISPVTRLNTFFAIAFLLGMITGAKALPSGLFIVADIALSLAAIQYALYVDIDKLFAIFPYLLYSELYVRDSFTYFPYNYLPYLSILIFTILLVRQKVSIKQHSTAFVLLIGYVLLELIDLSRAIDLQYAWMLFTNSLMLLLLAMWAAYNYLSPKRINRFLINIQMAGVFTCGYLTIAHFTRNITYTYASNASASNGLPPNQLSSYIGFPCILFAIALLNSNKNFVANLILFVLSCTLMIFTFSRGGIYFVAAILGLYFLFNKKNTRNYSLLLLLIPVGLAVFIYITNVTNGMVTQRYEEPGYSGRDRLAEAALNLFAQHPLAGVGTSNFNKLISSENLYAFDSGAHNEITRAMAEHGLLGIFTFWGFFIVLFFEINRRSKVQRDYGMYFLVLFLLTIVHNGLKTGLQPFILLLAIATPTILQQQKRPTHSQFAKS